MNAPVHDALATIVHENFFVLRAPLLPVERLLQWCAGAEVSGLRSAADVDAARDLLTRRLHDAVAEPSVNEALFVASPALHRQLASVEGSAATDRKLLRSLVRYYSRTASRSTPFGLFAGWCTGRVGVATDVRLLGAAGARRHVRLDMAHLLSIVRHLEHLPVIRRAVTYRPNTSAYLSAGDVRYAEASDVVGGRAYMLTRITLDDYVRRILGRATDGATRAEIAAAIVDDAVTMAEAEEFTDAVIDAQLLVSALAIGVTGADPLESLIAALERLTVDDETLATALTSIHSELQALNSLPLGTGPEPYRRIAIGVEALGVPASEDRLFQVDMQHGAVALTLDSAVCDDIVHGMRAICAFMPRSEQPHVHALRRFKQAFEQRYERQTIPLVEALDSDIGIGYPPGSELAADASPLLAGLAFGVTEDIPIQPWSRREWLLARKLKDAGTATEIHLSDEDVEAMARETTAGSLPASFAVMARLGRSAAGEIVVAIHGANGPSGANLLGRFCYADPELTAGVRDLIRREEATSSQVVFAEIAHLPEGRDGNVILRPILRDYEIPYLARSQASADRQIQLNDLLVSVTEEGWILLTSRRLGRAVIPRLSSAHGVRRTSPPIYQFLNAVQQQGVTSPLAWEWSGFESYSYLPRVIYGRTIVKLARWRIDQAEYESLTTLREVQLCEYLRGWRVRRQMPRMVGLVEGDNVLPVDWENVLSVENLSWMLRRKPHDQIVFTELFPDPGASPVSSPEGQLQNEIIVPLRVAAPRAAELSAVPRPTYPDPGVARYLPPGTEWLFLKSYCGHAGADDLLADFMAPLVRPLCQSGAAAGWFFIRYGDPEWHLRLRIRVPSADARVEVRAALDATLREALAAGRTWRVQYDTYQREIERYGGPRGILLAEDLFHLDSDIVVDVVRALREHGALDQRWLMAIYNIDVLLSALRVPMEQRVMLFNTARDQFAARYPQAGPFLRKSLSEKYRDCRHLVEDVVSATTIDGGIAAAIQAAAAYREPVQHWADRLRHAERTGALDRSVSQLLFSYAHMHINRMLRSAHQSQELVLYEFFGRLYRSHGARQRADASAPQAVAR
jgi:lantibiotic biosynthesis protein